MKQTVKTLLLAALLLSSTYIIANGYEVEERRPSKCTVNPTGSDPSQPTERFIGDEQACRDRAGALADYYDRNVNLNLTVYDRYSPSEMPPPVVLAQCEDGQDNDGDGLIDLADPGCVDSNDDDETDPAPPPPPPPPPPSGEIVINSSGLGAATGRIVFDNFESGIVGNQIQNRPATVGQWDSGGWSFSVYYTDAASIEGNQAAFHDLTDAMNSWSSDLAINGSYNTVYMDFFIRPDVIDNHSRNWKTWRMFGLSNSDLGNDVYYGRDSGGFGAECGGPWHWRSDNYNSGEWMHYRVVFRCTSNGLFQFHKNGVQMADDSFFGGGMIREVRIGHYWGAEADLDNPASTGAAVYTDRVYVSTTLQRTEICGVSDCLTQLETLRQDDQIRFMPEYVGLQSGPGTINVYDGNNNVIYSEAHTIP